MSAPPASRRTPASGRDTWTRPAARQLRRVVVILSTGLGQPLSNPEENTMRTRTTPTGSCPSPPDRTSPSSRMPKKALRRPGCGAASAGSCAGAGSPGAPSCARWSSSRSSSGASARPAPPATPRTSPAALGKAAGERALEQDQPHPGPAGRPSRPAAGPNRPGCAPGPDTARATWSQHPDGGVQTVAGTVGDQDRQRDRDRGRHRSPARAGTGGCPRPCGGCPSSSSSPTRCCCSTSSPG